VLGRLVRLSVALVDEFDDVLSGGAGEEDFGDAGLLEGGDVGAGNDAADEDGDFVHAFFVEEFHELGTERVVGAGEDGEANDVDVFLDGGGGDHLRCLAQAGVDHFHSGVAQGTRDYLRSAVVAIQPWFRDQYSNFLLWHFSVLSVYSVVKTFLSDQPLNSFFQYLDIKVHQKANAVPRQFEIGDHN